MRALYGSYVRTAFDWFFRNRQTGRITIAQFPNAPLWIFIVATGLNAFVDADPLRWIATAALVFWGLDELFRGVNPFRRMLGALMLAGVLLS